MQAGSPSLPSRYAQGVRSVAPVAPVRRLKRSEALRRPIPFPTVVLILVDLPPANSQFTHSIHGQRPKVNLFMNGQQSRTVMFMSVESRNRELKNWLRRGVRVVFQSGNPLESIGEILESEAAGGPARGDRTDEQRNANTPPSHRG